jgi:nicotinamidase-related amidase
VTQLVLIDLTTSIGVETAARAAYERGFNVTLALDAMSDTDGEAHDNSVQRIFPRLGEAGTTQQVLDLLAGCRS